MGAAEFATRESQPSVTTCEWIVGGKFAAAKPNRIVQLEHGNGEPSNVEEAL
jgi:hypothetical protein